MSSSDSVAPLRVVVIGYGLAGAVFHAPLIAKTAGMQVAAVVTRNAERQQLVRKSYPDAAILSSVEEVWRDPTRYDLVVVATPNRTHVPLGIAALNAGLPVVIDKPMAATVDDAQRLIATSKKTGKLLTIFQNRRWDNDFLTVRKVLAADLLGPITQYESRFERYRLAPRSGSAAWRELPEPEEAGGLLYDLGSHLIDQALFLFGKPQRVYAEMGRYRTNARVDDDTFVALQFASGVRAHLWMSAVTRIAGPRVRVSGLLGTYEKWGLDPQEDALRAGARPGDTNWGVEARDRWGHISTDVGGVHVD
ncbi:MAG TPA: Gfo/Idh/MocA family oxidoreductase, partial [Ktedonobacteraceae bacterium]|nr:Gfo/Idh/MocA family oxidoreductase [Ktedonobacteraceae bacterium]